MGTTIISIAVTTIIGVITFFLKRTISRVDKNEDDIAKIKGDYSPRAVHGKDIDELRMDIKKIKEDYITKEDFYREQNKTDRKLDRIMDILLEMKGEMKGE